MFLDGTRDIPCELYGDRTELRRCGLIDYPLDIVADTKARQVTRARRSCPGHDREQRAIFTLVVPTRKSLRREPPLLKTLPKEAQILFGIVLFLVEI